ncbi:MAG: NADPH:quinone oxidoreductase family protein [Xanthomonadales bacterium]|nr:NADPH:quinone oxidoreductase family protein [Xanthomonadales bacterium]
MRAVLCRQFGSYQDLAVEEHETPEAGPGEVLIEVRAAGLNFPDLLMIAGKYQVRPRPPFVPGFEAAGIVSRVGSGVSRFAPGDRVMATLMGGGFGEYCVAEENRVTPMPDSLDFEVGAGFAITYATSFHAFRQRAPIESGQTVLVLGAAGGVGSTACEIASAMGARVIAAASSPEKLEFARGFGADEGIDYSQQSLKDAVRGLTSGAGADVVYDPVGGELARQALGALAFNGRYLVVGFASGEIPAFPANLLLLREAQVIGVYLGDWAARQPRDAASNMQELADLVAAGRLRPRITAAYPVEQFQQAFATLAGRSLRGKIVLTF